MVPSKAFNDSVARGTLAGGGRHLATPLPLPSPPPIAKLMARLKPSKKGDVRQVTVATQKPTKAGQKKSTKKNGPSASSSLTIAPPPSITSTTTTPSKTDENLQKPHRLDVDQVDRAVRALRTHHAKVSKWVAVIVVESGWMRRSGDASSSPALGSGLNLLIVA